MERTKQSHKLENGMKLLRQSAVAALLLTAVAAQAFDFKAIGDAPAVMYDAPTQKGIKRFIAPAGMPVEVVHVSGEWSKVRDASGEMLWVETKALGAKRTVVVTVANAKIHAKAEDSAALVFSADKGVLLDMVEPVASGWIKVRHRDGQSGYVRASEVWGG
jgi:SH3-like domain-containing protein